MSQVHFHYQRKVMNKTWRALCPWYVNSYSSLYFVITKGSCGDINSCPFKRVYVHVYLYTYFFLFLSDSLGHTINSLYNENLRLFSRTLTLYILLHFTSFERFTTHFITPTCHFHYHLNVFQTHHSTSHFSHIFLSSNLMSLFYFPPFPSLYWYTSPQSRNTLPTSYQSFLIFSSFVFVSPFLLYSFWPKPFS